MLLVIIMLLILIIMLMMKPSTIGFIITISGLVLSVMYFKEHYGLVLFLAGLFILAVLLEGSKPALLVKYNGRKYYVSMIVGNVLFLSKKCPYDYVTIFDVPSLRVENKYLVGVEDYYIKIIKE